MNISYYAVHVQPMEHNDKPLSKKRTREGIIRKDISGSVGNKIKSCIKEGTDLGVKIPVTSTKGMNIDSNQPCASCYTPDNLESRKVELGLEMECVDPNANEAEYDTQLHLAVRKGNTNRVVRLLINGANIVNVQNHCGSTPLHLAVIKSNLTLLHILLRRHNIDTHVQNIDGDIPLHLAVQRGNIEIVKTLLAEDGMDQVNVQNYEGNTPLHLAAQKGYTMVAKELARVKGIDATIKNNRGYTPLYLS